MTKEETETEMVTATDIWAESEMKAGAETGAETRAGVEPRQSK